MAKEAQARIKINKRLEESGWRFETDNTGSANIRLEAGVKFAELGDDFENAETHDKRRGAIDFLLLDKDGRALVVVEAKKESVDPLSAKEQARNYACNVNARFIILSNGNIHYLWDTKHGNPETISRFPTQESITQYQAYTPNPTEFVDTPIDENYIMESQIPGFARDPAFQDDVQRPTFRGCGLGEKLIRLGCGQMSHDYGVPTFTALIKKENISSQYAFTKAGFQMTDPDRHHEKTAIVMKYAMGDHDHAEHQDR